MKIQIPAQDVSDIFWRNLSHRWAHSIRKWLPYLDNESCVAEHAREAADYNTGSVGSATAVALLILGAEMKPDVAFEVGTFIGNSTRALALTSKKVYTCDGSNDIGMHLPNVTQYPKTMSTAALTQFAETGQKIDLLFLDGRLQPTDLPLLKDLMRPETIVALDDCYQLEKGVANVSILQAATQGALFYLPPPRGEPFTGFGIPGGTTLGLMVPAAALNIIQA